MNNEKEIDIFNFFKKEINNNGNFLFIKIFTFLLISILGFYGIEIFREINQAGQYGVISTKTIFGNIFNSLTYIASGLYFAQGIVESLNFLKRKISYHKPLIVFFVASMLMVLPTLLNVSTVTNFK